MQFKKYCLLIIITIVFINSSIAQIDTLFWFAVPYGTDLHSNREANIVLSAMDPIHVTNIMITQPYNPIMDTMYITIDPLTPPATADIHFTEAELLEIMNNTYIENPSNPNPRISNCAIKIQADRDITAYYEYQRLGNNNDIFSLKGRNAMGQDFWIPFQDEWDNHTYNTDPAFAQIIIASTEPNTEVEITFPKRSYDILPGTYTFNLAEPGMTMMFVPIKDAGDFDEPSRFAVNRLDGTHITSNKPIVVTINDDSVEKNGWDFIGDQLVPIINIDGAKTIGLEYLVIKGEVTDNLQGNEKVFVLTTEDNTTVQYQRKGDAGILNLGAQPIASAGTQRSIDLIEDADPLLSNDYVYIGADKPIYVFHVSGFGGELGGALIPTIDGCTGSLDVTVVRAKTGDFFLPIMTHADALNSFEISSDGGAFVPFLGAADFDSTGVGDLYIIKKSSYKQNGVVQGVPTRIKNSKNVFHLGVINQRGGTCEYGYFSDFKEDRGSAVIVESGTDIITSCYGEITELKAKGGLSYSWTPAAYLDDPTSSSPTAFLPVGIHDFQVTIDRPCFPDTVINTRVQIYENTEAYFTLDENIGCAPLTVEINNLTLNADTFLIDFENDRTYDYFADTNSSTTLFHTYYNPTSTDSLYTLKLYAYDKKKDCPDVYIKNIRVFPEIDAKFSVNTTQGCNPLFTSFTDLSTSSTSDSYKWDFGDGQSLVTSVSPANVTHEFKHFDPTDTVDFYVELVATSPYFCRDTARETISVYSYLESEFTIDTAYGCSPFRVTFTNISAGQDSVSLIFGDGDEFNSNNFNILTHTFSNTTGAVVSYPVELQTFNDEGCTKVWRDTIVVYPEFKANYNIDGNSYVGCNERNVVFTNTTSPMSADAASVFLWEFGDGTNSSIISPSHVYDNNFSSDHDYIFTLHAESKYGCSDDTFHLITIHRAEAKFTVDLDEGCSPLEVNVTNSSIGSDITTWDWDYGDGYTFSFKDPVLHTYTNKTAASVTHKLLLEARGTNGCSSRDSVDITVYPEIKATYDTILFKVLSCDSLMVEFNSSVFHPGLAASALYTWNFGDGASSSLADPTYVYKNLASVTPIPYTVSLHVETPLGCSYDTVSQVVVNPLVKASIFIDKATGCSPLSVNVIAQNIIGNSNYDWDYGDAIGTNFIRDPVPYIYPANTSYLPKPGGDDNYELILEVENGTGDCIDRDTIDIRVYSEIVADFTPDVISGCNPLTVNFTDKSSANATDWNWDFDDGSTSSTQNTQNTFVNPNSFTQPFNVTLDVISDQGCTNTDIQQINVLPYVESDFDIDVSEGCSPLTVSITNNSLSSGTQWYWFWDKDDRVINAGVLAAADSTVNFASFTKTFVNNSGSSRTDSLTLIVGNGNGCYEIFKRAITIHSTIDAEFTFIPASGEGCNPLTVNFTNTTVNGSIYNWTFGDGSSTTTVSPEHEFINTGTDDETFTVRLVAESAEGCTDNEQTDITVYSKVISDFSIATSEGCPPFTTTIDNTSIGNSANTYEWFIDNVVVPIAPTDLSDFEHTYENSATVVRSYEVKLIATNPHGCTSGHTDIITAYEYVEASFSMDVNDGCSPLDVGFTDSSLVPTNTKYIWNFGDGASSGVSEPTHKFYNSSRTTDLERTIKLTVQSQNYCSDDTSMQINIYHQPLAKFYIDKTSSCPPLVSTLVKQSEGEDIFEWRFGDGNKNTVDGNLSYSWDNIETDNPLPQIYNLELWVGTANNCVDSTNLDLSVFPKVTADFTMDRNSGCSPVEDIQFTNASTSPATQFFWTFGDGTTTNLKNPMHDFVNITSVDRDYDVYLLASSEYNCSDDITKQVTVYVQPEAEFYVDPVLLKFPNNIVGFDNKTNKGPFDYLWEFGNIDASTSTVEEPISFEYEHWGEKIIKLTATHVAPHNECTDYYLDTVIILPPDVNADFITDIIDGCVNKGEVDGLDVLFTASQSAFDEEYDYSWDFDDGSVLESGRIVTHTFDSAGVYKVQLTATSNELGNGVDYAYKTITVYPKPRAEFDVSPTLAMLDPSTLEARVKFYNLSDCNDTSGCSYKWYFGDGETVPTIGSRDVTYGYTPDPDDFEELEDGTLGIQYDIKLVATTAHGCKDSLAFLKQVTIIGAGQIAFPNAFVPSSVVRGNNIFKPVYEGIIEYELLIYNRWGELIFTTKDVDTGWDGLLNGDAAKSDVYVWKAIGKFSNGRAFELVGDVTLIR